MSICIHWIFPLSENFVLVKSGNMLYPLQTAVCVCAIMQNEDLFYCRALCALYLAGFIAHIGGGNAEIGKYNPGCNLT